MEQKIARIHSFESFGAVDGPGIRFVIFMQGCPMRCLYCHNPDTWFGEGIPFEPGELVKKIERYKPYFGNNGGVTFSGGEPLLQAGFIKECIPLLRGKSINYVIDTSGAVELDETVKYVLKNSQMVILDLKFWDDESYLEYTGDSMKKVLKTLDFLESVGKNTVIRTVVVPDINDSEEMLEKYLPYIQNKKCVEKYELLAFHTMGFFKYEGLGIKNPFADKKVLDKEKKEKLQVFVNKKLKK